ncbi:MAG: hypothetical protein ABMA25_16650 [Ilumatobacteraceae bacterium]
MTTTTTDWSARIDYTGPNTDSAEGTAAHLLNKAHADTASFGPGSVTLRFSVEAETYAAVLAAVDHRMSGLTPAGWTIAGIELQRFDLVDAELARPLLPALVGISEAAELLGVSRQRAHAMAKTASFPPPIAELAAGPVYLETAVRAFAAHPRRSGRPPRGQIAG